MDFKQELVKLLAKELKWKEEEFTNLILVPPDPKMGDYAFPCFKVGGNPKEAAEKLKQKLKLPKFIERVEVAGPYLNFFLNKLVWAEETLSKIKKEKKKYGQGREKKNIVVEFCSPNTNKPLHLGHVRNMALGDAMVKLLSNQGNQVHPVEIVNDRGVHICKSMLAYERWGNNKKPDKKTDHFVGDYYVIFAKKVGEDPGLEEEAQQMLVKWEQGDKKVLALWKKMNSWVLDGFKETYKRFGIKFEKEYFESTFYLQGKEIAQEGLKKGIFFKDETGAVMVDLEKYGLGKKAILRADGTSIYFTQDLYLVELRQKDFHFDNLMYVVATEQNLHFKQLFKVLELLERPYAKNMYHLSYGMVNLPTGKMKSREGTVVDADDLMDELEELAAEEVRKRHEDLSEKEVKKRAVIISLGALKFYMLKTDAVRDMVFNPEESLSFEGETGPYVQYTHARACSLLRKAGVQKATKINFNYLNTKEELALIKALYEFPEALNKAAEQYRPHVLCNYLIALSQSFNEFYHAHQVIVDNKEQMQARLLLVDCVRQVLENGLALLGIEAPEEM
jgi:arginyl-tRNA synthetase